jgi:hypothetical protein
LNWKLGLDGNYSRLAFWPMNFRTGVATFSLDHEIEFAPGITYR